MSVSVSSRTRSGLGTVLVVNTVDRAGGAERSAQGILDGFQALGTHTHLAVGVKRTDDPRVVPFSASPHVDYRSATNPTKRALVLARRDVERRLGVEDFHHPHSRRLLDLTGQRPDLVLLVNLHGGYFDLRSLPALSRQVPVVMSLRDSWLFTGHCAVPPEDGRWETGCGSCPDLAIPPAIARDATRLNWLRKRRILGACRVAVTTPSRWLMDRARRSILAPAIARSRVVPNGLDLELFAPGSRPAARKKLGLDPDAHLLLFVAHEGRANAYKDFPTLRAATKLLGADSRTRRLELLVVGRAAPMEILDGRTVIRHLPDSDPRRLAEYYRAADLYVHAAREETFCNVAAEALACGTPVVAACAGGIREVVEHRRTGLHVMPGRPRELAEAVRGLLGDADLRERMGRDAARDARARFDLARNVADLHAWCAELALTWQRDRWHDARHAGEGAG
jgi:glycosyltransferase involved in cell wall biosynthesis